MKFLEGIQFPDILTFYFYFESNQYPQRKTQFLE
jgi:hypothetical protein